MHGRREAQLRAEAARAAAAELRQEKRQQREEAARAAEARRRHREDAARAAAAQRRQQEEAAYAATAEERAAQQAEVDAHARLLQGQREECGPGLRFRTLKAAPGMLSCMPCDHWGLQRLAGGGFLRGGNLQVSKHRLGSAHVQHAA